MGPSLVERVLHTPVQLLAEGGPQVAVGVQRRRDAGMAQPGLDLLGMGALGDEQGGARVPEIMKPEGRVEAGGLKGRVPDPAPEVRPSEQRPLWADEDELARRRRREVLGQHRRQERRHRQHPAAGMRLGLLHVPGGLPAHVLQRPDDAHLAAEKVEVPPLQADQLAQRQPRYTAL